MTSTLPSLGQASEPGPKQTFRVSREEAVAVALEVEMRTRKGESVPAWMRRVTAAI